MTNLTFGAKRLNARISLLDRTGNRVGFDGLVHGHDYHATVLAYYKMRAVLPFHLETKPTQRLLSIHSVFGAGNFCITAKTRTCEKWNQSRSVIFFPSKYPRTASVGVSCKSVNTTTCIEMPPPTRSTQRATKPPVSVQGVTVKINSMRSYNPPTPYAKFQAITDLDQLRTVLLLKDEYAFSLIIVWLVEVGFVVAGILIAE